MKLNKKVLTGALALAMGLGIAAPAVNSYAAESAKPGFEEDYVDAVKKYNAAKKALAEANMAYEKATDNREALEAVRDEAKKALEDYNTKVGELATTVEAEKALMDQRKKAKNDAEAALKAEDNEKNRNAVASAKTEFQSSKQRYLEAKEALENYKIENSIEDLRDNLDRAEDDVNKAIKEQKKAKEAVNAAETAYNKAKKDARDAGVDKAIIDKAEENGLYIPEKPETDDKEDLVEEIKAQLEVNKEKLAAAKGVKMYMPESYKLYKDRIDTAIANAEKAIKKAEDFLAANKKVALISVAYAAEEENTEAEDVLKDLQDSEKELDSVLGDIEKDSKEENDKNEEETKEEDKNEEEETETETDKEEETETDKEEDKKDDNKTVVVEKKDVKASKNVKTGVAGVAGVGAVLAAASAAYISSKRK